MLRHLFRPLQRPFPRDHTDRGCRGSHAAGGGYNGLTYHARSCVIRRYRPDSLYRGYRHRGVGQPHTDL